MKTGNECQLTAYISPRSLWCCWELRTAKHDAWQVGARTRETHWHLSNAQLVILSEPLLGVWQRNWRWSAESTTVHHWRSLMSRLTRLDDLIKVGDGSHVQTHFWVRVPRCAEALEEHVWTHVKDSNGMLHLIACTVVRDQKEREESACPVRWNIKESEVPRLIEIWPVDCLTQQRRPWKWGREHVSVHTPAVRAHTGQQEGPRFPRPMNCPTGGCSYSVVRGSRDHEMTSLWSRAAEVRELQGVQVMDTRPSDVDSKSQSMQPHLRADMTTAIMECHNRADNNNSRGRDECLRVNTAVDECPRWGKKKSISGRKPTRCRNAHLNQNRTRCSTAKQSQHFRTTKTHQGSGCYTRQFESTKKESRQQPSRRSSRFVGSASRGGKVPRIEYRRWEESLDEAGPLRW